MSASSAQSTAPTREMTPAAPAAAAAATEAPSKKDVLRGLSFEEQAALLRPTLERDAAKARETRAPLLEERTRLDAALASASAAQKKDIEAESAALEKKIDATNGRIVALDGELASLAEKGPGAAKTNTLLARQGVPVENAAATSVDDHDKPFATGIVGRIGKWAEDKKTTTTNELSDGVATSVSTTAHDKVGFGGVSRTTSVSGEASNASGNAKYAATESSSFGKGGVSFAKTTSQSSTKDGKTTSEATGTSTKLGLGGASRTDTKTTTAADGSSVATSRTGGIERGDGKLGASRAASKTTTDADGNATTREGSVKGGISAGADGYGLYAAAEGKVEKTRANGIKTGAVGGLDGNVNVNVTAIDGTDPVQYRVSVSVKLGGNAGLTGGWAKEGSGGIDLGLKAEGSGSMEVVKTLDEAGAKAYLDRLRAANGGTASGTDKELAVIATGVRQGWSAAKSAYQSLGADAGKDMNDGDQVKLAAEGKVSASLGGTLEAGGFKLGLEAGRDKGTSVETALEKKDGKLLVAKKATDSDNGSLGGSIGIGAVEGSMSFSSGTYAGQGFEFELDPKATDYEAQRKELAGAKTQAALAKFAEDHPEAVKKHTETTGDKGGQAAKLGVGPVKAAMGFTRGYDDTTTTDGKGKLVDRKTTGFNGGSLEVSALGVKLAASSKESATTTVDADGKVSLDVAETRTETDTMKLLGSLPGVREKEDKGAEAGLLTKAAGTAAATPDTTTTHAAGTLAGEAELAQLAGLALDRAAWMRRCPSPRLMDDWAAARLAVRAAGSDLAAVGRAVSRFVGKDGHGRNDVVDATLASVGAGTRYELPEGLAHLKPTFAALVAKDPIPGLGKSKDAAGPGKAVAEARQVLARLEGLQTALLNGQDSFQSPGVFGEMMARIADRKAAVQAHIESLGGAPCSVDDLRVRYNDLLTTCQALKAREAAAFALIEERMADGHTSLSEAKANGETLLELRKLHAAWRPQYEAMATLAQDHGFGAGIYFKYQPDAERFARALSGAPGPATEARPESDATVAERRERAKKVPVARAPADPVGDGKRDVAAKQAASATGLQAQVPAARMRANRLGNQLFTSLGAARPAMAVDAHNRGMAKLREAERTFERISRGATSDDWNAYGPAAIADFEAAARCFDEGLAITRRSAA